ncbi:hypothetical protein F0562_014197 [Nyssa sinensis]|uniref:MSP domain-containing protein n=1 Tax=Nyssa sinensis TaxID=561372 RepID=A0A5J4ZM07_9ASTE|nr:hypothetical protein F0562_014197 [Nyssa sinensis]
MAIADEKPPSDGKVWGLFKLPFRNSGNIHSTSSSHNTHQNQQQQSQVNTQVEGSNTNSNSSSVSSVARSLLPTRRRLRLDPSSKLYFPYEPGKQVRSAIRIKNTSKSHVAFKFQTTQPKSCFMRPPGAILAPGESLIATVFKSDGLLFPSCLMSRRTKLQVEQILRVVFLDAERPSPALEKLKRQLAEAEAALEARKKPPEDTGPKIIGEGLVIDEWKERRERYLARQQVEGVDSAQNSCRKKREEKMNYLSRFSKAAGVAVVEGQTDQCSKYNYGFRPLRPNSARSFSGGRMVDSGTGLSVSREGDEKRKQADDSLRKVLFLNCWAQS